MFSIGKVLEQRMFLLKAFIDYIKKVEEDLESINSISCEEEMRQYMKAGQCMYIRRHLEHLLEDASCLNSKENN